MKKTIIILALALVSGNVAAQIDRQQNREKIKSARIAWITTKLDLTPQQAEKFWPVYNEFVRKRNQAAKFYNTKKDSIDVNNASEAEKQQVIALEFEKKQAIIDLEKEYSQKLLGVISSEQLISLRKAEGDFRKMLINRLQKRQEMREKRRQLRQDYQQRGNNQY